MGERGTARVTARIALGRAMREHRRAAGLSGSEAGERLGWSQSKVSRIEAARVRAEVDDVRLLLDLYGVSGRARSGVLRLAEDAAGPASEWRNSTRVGLPRRQQDFVAFEAAATAITHYQPVLIPGPMQTPEYAARVLTIVRHPDPDRAIEAPRSASSGDFRGRRSTGPGCPRGSSRALESGSLRSARKSAAYGCRSGRAVRR
jgi:transcriptional regulator with XRE-family HTH domain